MEKLHGSIKKISEGVDWLLSACILLVSLGGLVTMKSFTPAESGADFFGRQVIWLGASFAVFFVFSFIDFRFLRRTGVLVGLYLFFGALLLLLFAVGKIAHGAESWFSFFSLSFQPVDLTKLVLVLVLAKYFSRRHVEIKYVKHILISALYAFIPFVLVLLQPDFGSAVIIMLIWLGMVLVSGISKMHLLYVLGSGALGFFLLWNFAFAPYQKDRIRSFLDPLANIHTSGYNAYQSTIAVGSGQISGKGVGYGTQSRLQFLPERQTDFIFAAFAEEWGFVGALSLLLLYMVIVYRVLYQASLYASNFEMLFGMGLGILFISHILINIGMNLGLLPVTGIPLPFMSYGGSHLLAEFSGLGILAGMRRYSSRPAHRDDMKHEFLGI